MEEAHDEGSEGRGYGGVGSTSAETGASTKAVAGAAASAGQNRVGGFVAFKERFHGKPVANTRRERVVFVYEIAAARWVRGSGMRVGWHLMRRLVDMVHASTSEVHLIVRTEAPQQQHAVAMYRALGFRREDDASRWLTGHAPGGEGEEREEYWVARVEDMRRAGAWPAGQWQGQWVVQQGWEVGTECGEAAREEYEAVHGGSGGDGQRWGEDHEQAATHVYACVTGASDEVEGRREEDRRPPQHCESTHEDGNGGAESARARGNEAVRRGACGNGGEGTEEEAPGEREEEAAPGSRQREEEEAAEEGCSAHADDGEPDADADARENGTRGESGREEESSAAEEEEQPQQQQEVAAAAALATRPGKKQRVDGRGDAARGHRKAGRETMGAAPGRVGGGGKGARGRTGGGGDDGRGVGDAGRGTHASLVERFVSIIEEERRRSGSTGEDGRGRRRRGGDEVTRAEREAHEQRKRKMPRGVFQKKRAKGGGEASGSRDVVERETSEEQGGVRRNYTGIAQRWSASAYRAYKAAMREKDGDVDRGEP